MTVRRPMHRAALAVIVLAACSGEESPHAGRWTGTLDTLPGGVVAVRNPATPMLDSARGWRLVEELRIGTADGTGPDVFSDVHDVAADAGGRIYVLQQKTRTVHVFDSAGHFVRAIGRRGAGPGEFERPSGITVGPDGRLWVGDPRNARYTAFDSTGAVVASHRRELGSYGWLWGAAFLADGRLLEQGVAIEDGDREGSAMVRFDSAFAPRDTLLRRFTTPEEAEAGVYKLTRASSWLYMPVPFHPQRALTAVDARGLVWFGDAASYRLTLVDLDGDTVRVVERPYEPVPVTDGDLASFRERARELVREWGSAPDESRIPRTKPAFSALTVADDGHLWVRLERPHGERGTVFDVFDLDGRYVAQVRAAAVLAAEPPVRVAADALYGVVRDELDVPQVVRFRLVRP